MTSDWVSNPTRELSSFLKNAIFCRYISQSLHFNTLQQYQMANSFAGVSKSSGILPGADKLSQECVPGKIMLKMHFGSQTSFPASSVPCASRDLSTINDLGHASVHVSFGLQFLKTKLLNATGVFYF
jgi:hypothetical protein